MLPAPRYPSPSSTSTWCVYAPDGEYVRVLAPHWLRALDLALDALGADPPGGRLATETLPNGSVIVRSIEDGQRFVIRLEGAACEAAATAA